MEYPIEKNVPVPIPIEEKQTKYAHLKVKADLMEVGDSIWVPTSYAADNLIKYLHKAKNNLYDFKEIEVRGRTQLYREFLYLRKKEPREGHSDGYRVWYLDKEYVLKSKTRLSKRERQSLGFSNEENHAYYLRVHNLNEQGDPECNSE